ncbi:hypothetical protein Thiowin_03202 [Thiorhodovibrio winogradskyi]|uniref:Coiled coil domain-containing protein n=1 Tax=Thiorhodovibrio winogradskyi TaxID=77007 RepID=A0ABZ0SAU2_9GAMM|nr:hypothetical protein [Thiorhodovibrio winogradskyi]
MTNKDEIISNMKTQLDEWNTEIDAMEARADEVSADRREDFDKELLALRELRDNGKIKLEELKSAGEGTWGRVKHEADHLWDALKASAVAFQRQYK